MASESVEEDGSVDGDSSNKLQACSHCNKTFKFRSEKIRHEMSHTASFECDICSKKFNFLSALRRHQKQHKRNERVVCEKCNKTFRDQDLLRRHVNYSHKVTLPCSVCKSVFRSEPALQSHMKTHKPVSERRYRCSHNGCNKTFNYSHHLKHHELTHTNDKQHYCSVCGKGFIQYHHMKDHMKSHEASNNFKCDFPGCDKSFATEYARKRHKQTHRKTKMREKIDNGHSSDSNSYDALGPPKSCEDYIMCSSCGSNFNHVDSFEHYKNCPGLSTSNSKTSILNNDKLELPMTVEKVKDCNTAVGGCIMETESCVCAQITQDDEEKYDYTPIGIKNNALTENYNNKVLENKTSIDFMDQYSEDFINFLDDNGNNVNNDDRNEAVLLNKSIYQSNLPKQLSSICEGCECASTCDVKQQAHCNGKRNRIEIIESNVEITTDGVVKIKDIFDIDIEPLQVECKVQRNNNDTKESDELVPFNTCKDVIGNCIAEGKGGCLCARMMMDDQQATEQEIDDITPVPKTESYV